MTARSSSSWDPTWETIFSSQEWGKYPPEELVRFVARNFYACPDRKAVRILDLGCGTGAATWFVAREGFAASGIDGSPAAIGIAKERFRREGLAGEFRLGDFLHLDFPDEYFDGTIDVVALQHNKPAMIARVLTEVRRVLKPGGRFFSMMLSSDTQLAKSGNPLERKGYVHYFDRASIRRLFSAFQDLTIETAQRTDRGSLIAHFIVTARK